MNGVPDGAEGVADTPEILVPSCVVVPKIAGGDVKGRVRVALPDAVGLGNRVGCDVVPLGSRVAQYTSWTAVWPVPGKVPMLEDWALVIVL